MKLYTINFNYNQPVPQKFTISTNTNFLIGVKATRNGLPVEIDPTEAVLIAKNGNQTHADEVLTNGYVTFQMGTTDTPYYTEYGLDVNGDEVRDFKIMLNVVKGDVGDIDAIGMTSVTWDDIQDKPDVLTPSSSEITELDSTVSALSESFGQLDSTVSELALSVGDVDAKVDELDSTVSALSESFGELDSTVSGLVDSLSSYATTDEMESAISSATENMVTGGAVGLAPVVSSAIAVYETDWASMSASADANTLYVVLPDPVLLTRVKYTTSSGLPDWEGDIVGQILGGDGTPTTQIPNVSDIEEISFGSHVTSIDQSAFVYCDNIKSVTIPNGVTTIGANVFEGCTEISSITIPDSVTSIGESAFTSCTDLSSVTIGNGVTSIGEYAFYNCSGLTSVTIPASVTLLGMFAFGGCINLPSITIPATTSIDDAVFDNCTSLMSITMEGRTVAEVQDMEVNHWISTSGCVIHCTDGDITI